MTVSAPTCAPVPENVRLAARSVPAAAGLFARVQRLLLDPNTSVADVVDMVRLDAGFASAVVRAANSALHRRGQPIESVNDAINRVGLRETHRVLGQAVADQLFVQHLPFYQITGSRLWENSLAVALAMQVLAVQAGEDGRAGYTLGLLRPAGRLVLQRAAQALDPARTAAAPTETVGEETRERALFGVSNAETTAFLMQEWRLAPELVRAVRHHLHPEAAPGSAPMLAARLHLACWMADALGKGLPSEARAWRHNAALTAQAGLPPEAPKNCLLDLREEITRAEALARGSRA